MARSKLFREIELTVNRLANDRARAEIPGTKDRERYRQAYLEQKAALMTKVALWAAAGESEADILERLGTRQRAKQQALQKALNEVRKRLLDME